MHRIKYSKSSLVESGGGILMIKNGLSVLLPLKSPKGLVVERMAVSDVGGGAAAAAMGGNRRFFNTGGITTESSSSSSLMKRDMFRAGSGDISNLFRGRQQIGGCVGSFAPHQCNKNHMLPYFARRALAFSSASQSSGQTQRQQEPEKKKKKKKKKRECQIKTISSELQRERCDEVSSTKVSLNQFPGLMVHGILDDSETRRLLRLNPDTGYFEEQDVSAAASTHHGHYELQVPHRYFCRGSAYGWLFLTDDNCDVKLLNPFSGVEIQLPNVNTLAPAEENSIWFHPCKWSVSKAVFSANPSIEPRPVVLIIYGGQYLPRLAFCKPGDKEWTCLEFPEISFHMDAIYHMGEFYVLGLGGFIVALDIGRLIDDDDHSVKASLIATHDQGRVARYSSRDLYLVVLDGELVTFEIKKTSFHRTTSSDETTSSTNNYEESYDDEDPRPPPPRTCGIKIRRFDASEEQWVKVESLGDKAVFLGLNTSFAVSASDYPAGLCIPDSVYLTDGGGLFHYTEEEVYDMVIYNVKNKSVKPLYSQIDFVPGVTKPAPIWIVNPSLASL